MSASPPPIAFLGFANHVAERPEGEPFPISPISIFDLSIARAALIYPIDLHALTCIALVNPLRADPQGTTITLRGEQGKAVASVVAHYAITDEAKDATHYIGQETNGSLVNEPWMLTHFKFTGMLSDPGTYTLTMTDSHGESVIGLAKFGFMELPMPDASATRAIASNPFAAKTAIVTLECKRCKASVKPIAAIDRPTNATVKPGLIWYQDLPDTFRCKCEGAQRVTHNLTYIKRNLHALLGRDTRARSPERHYTSSYTADEIAKTIESYRSALDQAQDEETVQAFLESHPLLLAPFRAKQIVPKPSILGKFFGDFLVQDSQDRLILIELESPLTPIFKADGHPTAKLHHAYQQVIDWLREFQKHPHAVLEGLQLSHSQIAEVRGAVIAGRKAHCEVKDLHRHISSGAYPSIDFFTLDDLADATELIARSIV